MRPTRIIVPLFLAILLGAPSAIAAAEAQGSREVRVSQIVEGGEAGSGHFETFTVPAPTGGFAAPGPAGGFSVQAIQPGEALGEQRTLVSLVHFTNDPSMPYSFVDVQDSIFDETNPDSAASYVLEASYGRAWLTEPFQWVVGQLPAGYDDTNCLIRTESGTQQLVNALGGMLDFSVVDRWIVIIPFNPNCGFAALSSLGKWTFETPDQGTQSFSRIILNGPSVPYGQLAVHELGHSFAGLQHSADYECGSVTVGPGCSTTGTDRYDVMATSLNDGHFTPPGKQALEWFDTQIVDVTGPGGTFLIEPYETTGPGIKALRIRADGYYDDYRELDDYWVSYRKPLGLDAGFAELATDGAMLHLGTRHFPEFTTSATGPSLLLDAKPNGGGSQETDSADVLLEVGQTFIDTQRGITIETLGTVGGALEVQVTIDQYCGNGVRDDAIGEVCDGTDLGTATCASLGFTSGTLACDASCGFDLSQCGPAVCAPGDAYDEGTDLCTASIPSAGGIHLSVYRNYIDWSLLRTITHATLLTASRGSINLAQNFDGVRSIIGRMLLPFDTSVLPDGALIDSASITLKHDVFWDPHENTHPDSADQLVLVQTSDPMPTVRELSDYGVFMPVDAPAEGAPRIDVSDIWGPQGEFVFQLNATGLSWIDDAGVSRFGMRTAFDVDDVYFPAPESVSLKLAFVPPDSPIAGPRLDVNYHPVPEPGSTAGLVSGAALLAWLHRRREKRR